MTQSDFIRNEIQSLQEMKDQYGYEIQIRTIARNIVISKIREKKRNLKEFIKHERRNQHEMAKKVIYPETIRSGDQELLSGMLEPNNI